VSVVLQQTAKAFIAPDLGSVCVPMPSLLDDPVAETLLLDRSNEPLGEGVAVRSPVRSEHGVDASVLQDAPELVGELGVAAADQEAMGEEKAASGLRVELET
jgi:hypothetical protein